MSARSDTTNLSPGFNLYSIRREPKEHINQIVWSPDGLALLSLSDDCYLRLWHPRNELTGQAVNVGMVTGYGLSCSPNGSMFAFGNSSSIILVDRETGKQRGELVDHLDVVNSLSWSPDGLILASGSDDKTIRLWDTKNCRLLWTLTECTDIVNCIAWSLDGKLLAAGSGDGMLFLWDIQSKQLLHQFNGYSQTIISIAWSPDSGVIASTSEDETIGLWDSKTGRQTRILEGHSGRVVGASFSHDGRILASKAQDGTIRLWRTDIWETAVVLQASSLSSWSSSIAFHPHAPLLATLGEQDTAIYIWSIDFGSVLTSTQLTTSVVYTNAKVVLVGESGVGKSGLGLVLTKQPFISTDSTHGRRIWTFDNQEIEFTDGRKEMREILLWDLAGQPGYRLIHQLHLNEVAVALIVFDSRNETDPFTGVYYWNRALHQAQQVQGNSSQSLSKFLVAARIDRGGKPVSDTRVKSITDELDIDAYFATSAKEGWGIRELTNAVQKAIAWETLPKVSSTDLFRRIKDFLIVQKESGQVLPTIENLYHTLLISEKTLIETGELRAQFVTCIGRLESQGLIRKLSFGNFILLQPELLDAYASALINAVKDEPDGLGSIPEEKAQSGDFQMPIDERLKDREQERLLLIAMVEDLLRHEIALRESVDGGSFLVFPSQSTRENPDIPDPEGKSIVFSFEGSIPTIYTTLAVRFAHSGMFERKGLWKYAVTYKALVGGTCGIFLSDVGEGRGQLTSFFTKETTEETRYHFEEYINTHLQRRAVSGSVNRQRIFVCPNPTCGEPIPHSQAKRRRERGFDKIKCGVCETEISLLDGKERLTSTHISRVKEMDRAADVQRERSAAASVSQGLQEVDSAKLRKAMRNAYNLAEFQLLCTDLQVNYEDLGGDILELKMNNLIDYCRRHRRYENLIDKVLTDRPYLASEIL